MHPILNKNLFFVKEQVGMFKASNNFDIYDGETQQQVLTCREPNLGVFTKMFRFTDYKRMTPFHIEIRTTSGDLVLKVKRGVTFFLSSVEVMDETGRVVGRFKQNSSRWAVSLIFMIPTTKCFVPLKVNGVVGILNSFATMWSLPT